MQAEGAQIDHPAGLCSAQCGLRLPGCNIRVRQCLHVDLIIGTGWQPGCRTVSSGFRRRGPKSKDTGLDKERRQSYFSRERGALIHGSDQQRINAVGPTCGQSAGVGFPPEREAGGVSRSAPDSVASRKGGQA